MCLSVLVLILVVLVVIVREVGVAVVHAFWLEVLLSVGVRIVLFLVRCIGPFAFVNLLMRFCGLVLH